MDPFKLLQQKWNPPADPDVSFAGKTVIVTGGSSGLGFEAALKFARKGASKVILGVRSLANGQVAKDAIESKTGRKSSVEVWELEMGDYDSIKAFVKKAEGLEKVDIVVLNAGLLAKDYRVGKYGWEATLQVNVLSTSLLAILLLPKLRASKTAHWTPVIEIVSSGLHAKVNVSEAAENAPLEEYNKPEGFEGQQQYNRSKLLVQCVVRALAKRLQPNEETDPEVIITSVCPGACATGLGRELMTNFFIRMAAAVFFALFFRTAEQGARSFVSATIQGNAANGRFWKNDVFQPDAANISGEKGERLVDLVWYEVVRSLSKDVPEITGLVN
ncbi:uncharacterized protein PV09_02697 [Verruconis gallopava]|uniref:Ketoreductase (KR) domain-containing protein n=1 Tax=Verruconis gallopava TaxID=253628 RepID=A0A0D1XTW7_9PEZI|nr:uncharacterized protein PV09_02697 [Verruconis gallopava]KIW06221.1 hypothetical protein PV09_02697 [Verruconis gallopava]